MQISAEVLERVDTDDHIELRVVEGQRTNVVLSHLDLLGNAGGVDHRLQLCLTDPSIQGNHLDVGLPGQEDRGGSSPATEIEHAIAGSESEVDSRSSQLPSGCGPMSSSSNQAGS